MRRFTKKVINSEFLRKYLFYFLGYLVPVRLVAWYLRSHLVFDKGKSDEVVFCLSRTAFNTDIEELRTATPLSFIVLSRSFTVAQYLWFPLEMQEQTYYSTLEGKKYQRALSKSEKMFDMLLDYIEYTVSIKAIFSANFDYWQEAGLFRAAVKRGRKIFILSREHAIDDRAIEEVKAWYSDTSFRFELGKICVAGTSTKNILLSCGVCNSEQILETGLPRFDPWVRLTPAATYNKNRKYITLMSFAFGYYADDTFKDVLKNFVSVGKKHQNSNAKFVIKSKDLEDTLKISSMLSYADRRYIEITHDISLIELLLNSRVVVGYNSLAMVEAALAKCPVIFPAWGQCRDYGPDVIFSKARLEDYALANFSYSRIEFRKQLEEFVAGATSFEPKKDEILSFVRKFISFDLESTSAEKIYSEFKKL